MPPSSFSTFSSSAGASPSVLIVGAGIFGLSASLALHARGYHVTILEPGPVPHPQASSTDISKVVRMEYGADDLYLRLAATARNGWLGWNDAFVEAGGEPLYHESGIAVLSTPPMSSGSFAHDSLHALLRNGYTPEVLDAPAISERFPAWRDGAYHEGFFHAKAGFAQSGRVVAALARLAKARGCQLLEGQAMARLVEEEGRVVGVETTDGEVLRASHTIVAAGVWTPVLLPHLSAQLQVVGQPIFHLQVDDPTLYEPPHFCTFTADISRTGWYGFPLHPKEGVLKIANHGRGRKIHPVTGDRSVNDDEIAMMRQFLRDYLPGLADAPLVHTRLCLYCETADGHFLIDHDPTRPGLVIASGGSGHGFKFGPALGGLIVDVLEGKPHFHTPRFAWRDFDEQTRYQEAARCML